MGYFAVASMALGVSTPDPRPAAPRSPSAGCTNSMYASSSATSTSDGTFAMNASNSAAVMVVPDGLFGLQMNTRRVRSPIAAAMASRSWRWASSSGTATGTAPATRARIGYASKLRHAKTTSSPSAQVAWISCWHSAEEPQPTATCDVDNPRWPAMVARTSTAAMSG